MTHRSKEYKSNSFVLWTSYRDSQSLISVFAMKVGIPSALWKGRSTPNTGEMYSYVRLQMGKY